MSPSIEPVIYGKYPRGDSGRIRATGLGINADFGFLLYALSTVLLAANYFLYQTGLFEAGKDIIRVIALVLVVCALLLNFKKVYIELLEILTIGILTLAVAINGLSAANLLIALLYGIMARVYGTDRVLGYLKYLAIAVLAVNLLCVFVGVLQNYQYVSTEGRYRQTMGYTHPNTYALSALGLLLVYVGAKRRSVALLVVSSLAAIIAIAPSDSRSSLFVVALFVSLVLLFSLLARREKFKLMGHLGLLILIAAFGLSLIAPQFAGTPLDQFLSYRLSVFAEATRSMTSMDWFVGSGVDVFLDNFYLNALATYGFPAVLLMAVFIGRAIIRMSRCRDAVGVAFICALVLLGLVESSLVRPELLVVMAFWVMVFTGDVPTERHASTEVCLSQNLESLGAVSGRLSKADTRSGL